jgi:hypothetical protein
MATAKKSTASKAKKSGGHAKKSENRCWEGYEPTPGKKPGTKGSCKPKD